MTCYSRPFQVRLSMASRICDLRVGAGRDAALAARRALSMSPRAAGAVGSRYSNRMSSVRCAGRVSVVLSGQLGGLAGIAAESWAGGSTVAAICTRGGSPPLSTTLPDLLWSIPRGKWGIWTKI